MADQEDQSPTLKTPRITPDQVQANMHAAAEELAATHQASVVKRQPQPTGPVDAPLPPVTAQPAPWWLQASAPPAAPPPRPAVTRPAEQSQPANQSANAPGRDPIAEPDDAATGPVPAVAIMPDPSSMPEADRYASSYEEYATNAFAVVTDAPAMAAPEMLLDVLPELDILPNEQLPQQRAWAEPASGAWAVPAPELAPIPAAADVAAAVLPAPAAIVPPPAWVQALQQANDVAHPEPVTPVEPDLEENDMPQMQWEYCRVQLDSGSYTKSQNVGRYPYYVRVAVDYYGAEVPPTVTFSEDTDALDRPHKIWGQILGQLGLANWEMINIYTGTAKDYSLVNVMAYFKRTVQPDRRVAEPKLTV